jgi:hypothetical protein
LEEIRSRVDGYWYSVPLGPCAGGVRPGVSDSKLNLEAIAVLVNMAVTSPTYYDAVRRLDEVCVDSLACCM